MVEGIGSSDLCFARHALRLRTRRSQIEQYSAEIIRLTRFQPLTGRGRAAYSTGMEAERMSTSTKALKQCQPILQHDPLNIWFRLEQVPQISRRRLPRSVPRIGDRSLHRAE